MSTIAFSHRMQTPLSPSALYGWMRSALVDTDRSPLWPRSLNRVVVPQWTQDASFEATYRLPGGWTQRSPYRLADLRDGLGFSYAPGPGHPFVGWIDVDVVPDARGSALWWRGSYTMAPWRPERAYFLWYLEPRFFPQLAAGLASLPADR